MDSNDTNKKMKEATAELNSYRQSPRKFRLVANAIQGKSVTEAKNRLSFITKRAVSPLHKLLNSALSNAKNQGLETDLLFVKSVRVDAGKILYRRLPAAHGSAHPMRKRTSHVRLVLVEKGANQKIKKSKK